MARCSNPHYFLEMSILTSHQDRRKALSLSVPSNVSWSSCPNLKVWIEMFTSRPDIMIGIAYLSPNLLVDELLGYFPHNCKATLWDLAFALDFASVDEEAALRLVLCWPALLTESPERQDHQNRFLGGCESVPAEHFGQFVMLLHIIDTRHMSQYGISLPHSKCAKAVKWADMRQRRHITLH